MCQVVVFSLLCVYALIALLTSHWYPPYDDLQYVVLYTAAGKNNLHILPGKPTV